EMHTHHIWRPCHTVALLSLSPACRVMHFYSYKMNQENKMKNRLCAAVLPVGCVFTIYLKTQRVIIKIRELETQKSTVQEGSCKRKIHGQMICELKDTTQHHAQRAPGTRCLYLYGSLAFCVLPF
ncbi:hypothetical protein ACJX0J_021656, partial [Zea mays]